MKDPKDIEKLFAKTDEQLTQRPPSRAWNTLSERLDQQEAAGPPPKVVPLTRRFPAWQVAASILLLIGLFTFATRQLPSEKHSMSADASGQIFLEDIPMEEDKSGFYALAVKCTQYYNISPADVVAEGSRSNSRLRLSERTNRYAGSHSGFDSSRDESSTETERAIADLNMPIADSFELSEPIAMADETFGNSEDVAGPAMDVMENRVKEEEIGYKATESIAMDEIVITEYEGNKAAVSSAPAAAESTSKTANESKIDANAQVDNVYLQSRTAGAAKDMAKKEKKRRKNEETVPLNAASNVISFSKENNLIGHEDIASFQWLIGQWEAQSDQQQVKQQWVQKDQFTLEGKATFSVNGQEIQVQKMEIHKGENGIYFILANLADNSTQKYRLKSMEAYQAIFAGKDDQEEFIIQQLDNNQFNNFSNQLESQSILKNNATPFNNLNFSRVQKE